MIYAYARCSLDEHKQDIQRQTRELKEAGAESIRWEFQHGDSKNKKEYHIKRDKENQANWILLNEHYKNK